MKQKDNKLEIVSYLIKQESHLREIALKLKTNPMMISRKIKELLNENVVNLEEKGRNSIYSLKNTVESRSYVIMAENYNLIKFIEKNPSLYNIIEEIQKDCILIKGGDILYEKTINT